MSRELDEREIATDTAWKMFKKTGDPSYYMLYSKLKNKR